jgi:glycosyltransferase involved in cell wall biosynthesis
VLELIEAADGFLAGHPEATLTVIGDAPARAKGDYLASVRRAAAAARAGDRIEFRPYVLDASSQVAQFDLVVVPSHAEPLGLVAAEAATVGVPVVGSDVAGLAETIGEGGVLVPPKDPVALAQAVSKLLEDPDRRGALSERALAGASRFDPNRFAQEMEALLKAAVSAPR